MFHKEYHCAASIFYQQGWPYTSDIHIFCENQDKKLQNPGLELGPSSPSQIFNPVL